MAQILSRYQGWHITGSAIICIRHWSQYMRINCCQHHAMAAASVAPEVHVTELSCSSGSVALNCSPADVKRIGSYVQFMSGRHLSVQGMASTLLQQSQAEGL